MIELNVGQMPSAALLDAVLAETAGNPFFVIELAHLLARTGAAVRQENKPGLRPEPALTGWGTDDQVWRGAIPPTVRGAIRQRLDRLSPACNALLDPRP